LTSIDSKSKIMKQRALIVVKEIFGKKLYKPASLISLLRVKESSECKSTYGFELPPTDLICLVVSVVNLGEN
jgi:hypothetical protein